MSATIVAAADRTLAPPRVAAALLLLLFLALVLPFEAVRTLHRHRLNGSLQAMAAIAAELRRAEDGPVAPTIPSGTQILIGIGTRAQVDDDRWNTAVAFPLARVASRLPPGSLVDPWGNAYVVVLIGSANPRSAWILSAGPDGILQTPLDTGITAASGDDRGIRVR